MSAWRVNLRGYDYRPEKADNAEILSDGTVQIRENTGRAGSSRVTTMERVGRYEAYFMDEDEAARYALDKYAEAIRRKRAELITLETVRANLIADISRRAAHEASKDYRKGLGRPFHLC